MILACHGLEKWFGDRLIVKNGNFHLQEREKAALVGINGAGKTTILNMIVKEEPLDAGEVVIAKGKTVGYLRQSSDLNENLSIYDEILTAKAEIVSDEEQIRSIEKELKFLNGEKLRARLDLYDRLMSKFEKEDGYAYRSEAAGVLKGLGFAQEEFGKRLGTLSGGQKTRIALGKLLLKKPDVLLLDEPTNHLDLNSVSWLETYLQNYPGAVLLVSHDRFFLDRIVTKVIEIENGKIQMYSGNYRAFADKKQRLRDAAFRAYLNRQREIRHQEEVIAKLRSFNREKSIRRAESREKMLNKIKIEKPQKTVKEIRFSLVPCITSGKDVLSAKGISKAFGKQVLFENVDLEISRGEHVAIIGDNGTGKTTFLKIINRILPPDTGLLIFGSKVHIGYDDQEHRDLDSEKTVFEEILDSYPSLDNTKIRNCLAAFQFTGDDVFKLIGTLSGGEKERLCLAKLMLSEANFLILDEPTNGLDITSKEILENALNEYKGTVLYVSHDRYFINRTASRVLELFNRSFVNYLGNYEYYLEKKEQFAALSAPQGHRGTPSSISQCETEAKSDWLGQKERQAEKRKRVSEFKKTEEKIFLLEERNKKIDLLMTQSDVYSDAVKCQQLSLEKAENERLLSLLYQKWEKLAP